MRICICVQFEKYREVVKTEGKAERLTERYASCPIERKAITIDKKTYTVTKHFTEEKNVNAIISEIALSRVKREFGI